MHLTPDEHRALAFIAALLCLSAAVRLLALPEPVEVPGGLDLATHVEAVEAAVEEKAERERPLEPGETVDPNTATAAELTRLPGVGPALADRIVADRKANGRYRTLGDLERVPGIGPRTAQRLAPHVTLREGPATHGGSSRSPATREETRRTPTPPTSPGLPVREEEIGTTKQVGEAPIDVNHADAEALAGLPGIGPVLAARIVAYRDSAGPFRDVSELAAVKGIGQATIVRIADRVLIK